MSLILETNLVHSAINDADETFDPRLAVANILRASEATVTESAETAVTGVSENAYAEGLTFDFWRPGSSGTHWLRASFTAAYESLSLDVSRGGTVTAPRGVGWGKAGTRLYVTDTTTLMLYQYNLARPYDIRDARFVGSFSLSSEITAPRGIRFSSDGMRFYIPDGSNSDVESYDLGTAWEIETAAYAGTAERLSVSAQDTNPQGLCFSDDGTRLFVATSTTGAIWQYNLGTAWALSTASYASKTLSIAAQDSAAQGLDIRSDGRLLYLIGSTNDDLCLYDLATANDLATAVYRGTGSDLNVNAQDGTPSDIAVTPDGARAVILGQSNARAYQYRLGVAANCLALAAHDLHDTGGTVKAQRGIGAVLSMAGKSAPVSLRFGDSGTKLYVLGSVPRTVYQFTLSTAYDLSTAVYAEKNIVVGTQDGTPTGIAFKTDGLAMFIAGDANNKIFAYTLGTAWDVSTAVYDGGATDFAIAEDATVTGIVFRSTGLVMLLSGNTNNKVYQYDLGSAWNPSTAVYSATDDLDVSAQDSAPMDLFITSDGLTLFIVGDTNNKIFRYTLGTGWDLSTAAYDGASFDLSVAGQQTSPSGIDLSPDGVTLVICGSANAAVHAYTLATALNPSTAEFLTWSDVTGTHTVRTSAPLMLLYDDGDAVALHHRLVLTCTSAPSIGVVSIGCALKFDAPISTAWKPPHLARAHRYLNEVSDGGAYLGRSVIAEGADLALKVAGIDPDWLRSHWEPAMRLLETSPFFFCARDADSPDGVTEAEVFYGWLTGDAGSEYSDTPVGRLFLTARGIVT